MKEFQLGELLAVGPWNSFPGFSSGATDFRFVFGTDAARERFLSTFLHCTVILPGGKKILLDTYLKWEKPDQWGLHMGETSKMTIDSDPGVPKYKIKITDGTHQRSDRPDTRSLGRWNLVDLKRAVVTAAGGGHSIYMITYLVKKDARYATLTEGEVKQVVHLLMKEGRIVKPNEFYRASPRI